VVQTAKDAVVATLRVGAFPVDVSITPDGTEACVTPHHRDTSKDVMENLSPMGQPSTIKDITDAVMYLNDAATVTGDILYVDGGSHFGRW
jgi:enoyl-[acyl-carrier-protein] reductase (NADH)